MQQHDDVIAVSIVVPVYNGDMFLSEMINSLGALRHKWQNSGLDLHITEAIFVLDEPIDGSAGLLEELAAEHAWVRLVELSRNYGQHSATIAGILYSSGDWVVTLDEDLQHRPMQIEALLETACSEKADIVYASPKESVHGGGYRDLFSRITKFIISKLSGNEFVKAFNSFRLIRGDIARAAASIGAQYTYFDVTLTWFTKRISSIQLDLTDDRYKNRKTSGYRLGSLIKHATKMVLTSNFQVLRFSTSISALTFLTSIMLGIWVVYSRFFAEIPLEVPGWASLMIVILALGSVSVFMLGLIIEFLHSSMLQLQGKPTFFVVNRASDAKLIQEVNKLIAQ